MKKLSLFVALAALAAIPFTGCTTEVGVDNQLSSSATWNSTVGTLTTKYPGKTIDEVFEATKRGIDQLYGINTRVGEDRPDGKSKIPSYTVYARVVGDIKVTVQISTAKNQKTKEEWTQAVVQYGTWGNLKESQKVVSAISKNI